MVRIFDADFPGRLFVIWRRRATSPLAGFLVAAMSAEQETEHRAYQRPSASPREVEPMDPQLTSIQPGGGACMKVELAWGRLRRRMLKRFRPGYVEKMRALRRLREKMP